MSFLRRITKSLRDFAERFDREAAADRDLWISDWGSF